MTDDSGVLTDDAAEWAEIRRALIAEANRERWTAGSVRKLLIFARATYDTYILHHPSFPKGVLVAYLADGGS